MEEAIQGEDERKFALEEKVVQVQRNAESFFGHNEEDKESLMQENTNSAKRILS